MYLSNSIAATVNFDSFRREMSINGINHTSERCTHHNPELNLTEGLKLETLTLTAIDRIWDNITEYQYIVLAGIKIEGWQYAKKEELKAIRKANKLYFDYPGLNHHPVMNLK